jgi:single-stranded-DNA-specific exonuclease
MILSSWHIHGDAFITRKEFLLRTTTPKRWLAPPAMPPGQRDRFPHLDKAVVQILYNRNVREPEQVRAFLAQDTLLHDPFHLQGMEVAVARIVRAVYNGERIAVYGDFDADGVTATALLTQTLQALGATVTPYIPDRVEEGYGLNTDALDKLAQRGADLIITVDCGIRSADEVAHGNRLGLDIIVTDHHSVGPELPPALAVINPRQPGCGYPFKDLAGVGIAFKLAQALLRTISPPSGGSQSLCEKHLLDLVALGTVADIVPLLDENRSLVQRGLEQLNAPWRKGIQALMAGARIKPGHVNSTTVGFMLGPRINAAGRLQDAMLAYWLLMTRDETRAQKYADQLSELNRERQSLTQEATERARTQVVDETGNVPHLLFAASPDFKPGIVGLVASRLREEFYRPSVVLERGDTQSRASCRSIPEFHITRALDECADLLVRHGGHAAAAGFTVRNEKLAILQERLQAIAGQKLGKDDLVPKLQIDAELILGPDLYDFFDQLAVLGPFGDSNPVPVFVSRRLRVGRRETVGADGQHLKLAVNDGRAWWNAIAFRRGKEAEHLPEYLDLAYHLDMNEWNGRRQVQLIVQDWRSAS